MGMFCGLKLDIQDFNSPARKTRLVGLLDPCISDPKDCISRKSRTWNPDLVKVECGYSLPIKIRFSNPTSKLIHHLEKTWSPI